MRLHAKLVSINRIRQAKDYYKGKADGVKKFVDRLRVNFYLYSWKKSDEVIDCTLADMQKGTEE